MISSHIKNFILLTLLGLLLPCTLIAQDNTAVEGKRVLVLNSYHQGFSWTDKVMEGVLSVFDPSQGVELYVEYMDTKRKADQQYFLQLKDLYQYKYEGVYFDAIVSSDDHALDFLLKFRDELYPETPVFFSGVNNFKDSRISGHKLFTGVVEQSDISGTLDLILELHPHTNLITVVNDNTKSGIASGKKTRRVAEQFKDRVQFKYLTNLSEDELKDALSELPRDAIVIYITYLQPPNRPPISIEKSTQIVLGASNLPVYGYWDQVLGHGILGGKVVSAFSQGETAAGMALRYLNGESFTNIGVEENSPNAYMFDYTALKKFNIDEGTLPPKSIILNKPFSLYEKYKTTVWVIVIFIVFLILVIMTLLIFIQKRKKAEQALQRSEERWQFALEGARDGMWDWNVATNEIFFSPLYKGILGFTDDEFGNYFDEWVKRIHLDDKELVHDKLNRYLKQEIPTYENEYRLLCKDGSYKSILARGKIISWSTDKKPLRMIGTHTDITGLKKAEEKLINNAARFERWKESNFIGIVQSNEKGDIVDANNMLLDMLGYSKKDLLDGTLNWASITPKEFLESDKKAVEEAKEKGFWTPYEKECFHKNGSRVPIIVGGTQFADDSSEYIVFIIDLSKQKQSEHALKKNQALLIKHQGALLALAKERNDNIETALSRILRVTAEQLHVSRVSVWLLNKGKTAITCKALYDNGNVSYKEIVLESDDYPSYFSAIHRSGFISASDAHNHPDTIEFCDHYLTPLGITSMLDSPIRIQGETIGITCCEHVGPKRKWALEEEDFSRSVSELCAQAFLEIEQKKSDEKLQLSARVFTDSHEGIIITDADKVIVNVNPSFCKITGYSEDEVIGQNPRILSSGKQSPKFYQDMWQEIHEHGYWQGEVWNRKKGGVIYVELLIISMLKDEFDNVVNYVGVFSDITQLKEQQSQLQRTQKMDALGKLVGGIAHDYNNMLGVILGYSDLIKMKFPTVDGLAKYINNIAQAGERGRKLTQRMLNFSKKESSGAEATSINEVLNSQEDLLSKAVTALITIHYDLSESDWLIWVDQSELEDVLLNLSINAQHAMVNGGSLTLTTQAMHLDAAEAKFLDLAENDYLKLTIRDTGCGMSDELTSKIFDPFFSTKGSQGTGLGLSQVYGFMERSGGAVKVYSEVGVGSEFSFYFPRYRGGYENETERDMPALEGLQGEGETILVVDDEPALRNVAAEILRLAGYHVLMASDGDEALDTLACHAVDLVLSDVIMPYMDGYQLAKHIGQLYPEVKVQLASGYSDNRHIEVGVDQLHKTLLHKPYSSFELMSRISQLLAGAKNE